MADVLLTVSGVIPPDLHADIAAGRRPCPDYVAMAAAFDADLLDYARARRLTGRRGRIIEQIGGPNLLLAWTCRLLQDDYRLIFTDGEQVGLPLAALWRLSGTKRSRHFMIAHILSVGKKLRWLDHLRLYALIDRFFVYSSWQKRFIEARWPLSPGQVVHTPFMVDADFFAPATPPCQRKLICAVGLERRDYLTLIDAVKGLDVEVVIAAASPWSKQADATAGVALPENVTVRSFSQYELRRLYADACFTVMPLEEVNFQAGVTALLEAMAMARAVICTRTPGQSDVVIHGETGLYVPAHDSGALRQAIATLLAEPDVATRMGLAGRQRILQMMSLARYCTRLAGHVRQALMETAASVPSVGNAAARPRLGKARPQEEEQQA